MKTGLTRKQASQIATELIEGGINSRGTTKVAADGHGVSIAVIRAIRAVVLKGGIDNICSYADAIENGWEDESLGLIKDVA